MALTGTAKVVLQLVTDNKNFGKGLMDAGKRMERFGKTATRNVTLPILAVGTAAFTAAANFEKSMNRVKAVTGATGEQFEALKTQAKDLGRTTEFSASEAAEGMKFLGMAGFEANEILSAMPATLTLASAGTLDLGEAADIVTNIISGYGLKMEELPKAVDVLAKAFTSANVDLRMLGDSFSYAAMTAETVGIPFEETAAAFAIMGDRGIQASRAGVALRAAINEIADPSDDAIEMMDKLGLSFQNAEGNMKPLVQIIEEMSKALEGKGGLEQAGIISEIANIRGGEFFKAILSAGPERVTELLNAFKDSEGWAANIQKVQLEGAAGELVKLKSAAEGLAIAIGDSGLLTAVTEFVVGLTDMVRVLAELDPAVLNAGVKMAGFAAMIGPVFMGVGNLIKNIGLLNTVTLPAFVTKLGIASGTLGTVLGLLAAAAVVWTLNVVFIMENWDKTKDALEHMDKMWKENGDKVKALQDRIRELNSLDMLTSEQQKELEDTKRQYEELIATMGVMEDAMNTQQTSLKTTKDEWGLLGKFLSGQFYRDASGTRDELAELRDQLDKVRDGAKETQTGTSDSFGQMATDVVKSSDDTQEGVSKAYDQIAKDVETKTSKATKDTLTATDKMKIAWQSLANVLIWNSIIPDMNDAIIADFRRMHNVTEKDTKEWRKSVQSEIEQWLIEINANSIENTMDRLIPGNRPKWDTLLDDKLTRAERFGFGVEGILKGVLENTEKMFKTSVDNLNEYMGLVQGLWETDAQFNGRLIAMKLKNAVPGSLSTGWQQDRMGTTEGSLEYWAAQYGGDMSLARLAYNKSTGLDCSDGT